MADIYIKVDSNTHVVTFVHKRPFDPVNGMGISREELSKTGFFVNEFPEPAARVGKRAVAYYDHEQKKIYYEYIPTPFTTKARIDMIEQATNDMLMLLADVLSGPVSPYTVTSETAPISTFSALPDSATMPIANLPTRKSKKIASVESEEQNDEEEKNIATSYVSNIGYIAKYLASQIYQGRLDRDKVFLAYPQYAEQIQSQLDKWEITD